MKTELLCAVFAIAAAAVLLGLRHLIVSFGKKGDSFGEGQPDRGGLLSGMTQPLKETALTGDFKLADGFLLRGERRRDFSNQEFFLSDHPDVRKTEQNTAGVGVIWRFGRKQDSW